MLSLRPTTARLLAKFKSPRPCTWEGFKSEELYPATVLTRSPALALPDEFHRITGVIDGCDLLEWIEEARGGEQAQAATRRFCLGPTLVADGSFYYRGGFEVLRSGNAKPIARGAPLQISEAQLASISVTEEFFGHWLIDGSLMVLLAMETGLPAIVPWTTASQEWGHRHGYEQLMQLNNLHPRIAYVDKLWAVDDKPRNAGRAERLKNLRARIRRNGMRDGGNRVILRRGLTGARRHLINEDEICEVLANHYGFRVIDPGALTPCALVDALINARIVLGVEGSHMFHAIAAAEDTALLFMIMPPSRFSPALKWYTDMIEMQFGFTVAEQHGDDFWLPIRRLHAAIEMIEKTL